MDIDCREEQRPMPTESLSFNLKDQVIHTYDAAKIDNG